MSGLARERGTGNMNDVLIIGIAGGSGSGKTTLTNQIASQFQEHVTVLKHDNYYKAHDDMTYEERTSLNYDYKVHNRSKDTITIVPSKVVIVEGILIFENKELCKMMDVRVFVDTDPDVRLIRRIQRDVMERARSLESVINQYINTVKPMHEQFVEPSKKNANIIIPEGGYNKIAMEMLQNHINSHLKQTAQETR